MLIYPEALFLSGPSKNNVHVLIGVFEGGLKTVMIVLFENEQWVNV